MCSKLSLIVIGLYLLHFSPIYSDISSCKHYQDENGVPYPLDICATQSNKGVITSTKTICDYESRSTTLLHQTFSGTDCSDSNLLSQETWGSDRVSWKVCYGNDCAVSFRTYSSNDCNLDFLDLVFIRGISYTDYTQEQTQCAMYDCLPDEEAERKSIRFSEIDCGTQTSYIESTYYEDLNNCQKSPLYCGSSTGASAPIVLFPDSGGFLPPSSVPETSTAGIEQLLPAPDFLQPSSNTEKPSSHTTSLSIVDEFATGLFYNQNHTTNLKIGDSDTKADAASAVKYSGYELRIYALPSLPIESICFTIVFLVLLGLIYFFWFDSEVKKQIVTPLKIAVIVSVVFNVFGIICIVSVSTMMQMMVWNDYTYNIAIIPYYGSVIGYVGGKFCLEIFFILRIYTAFKDSMFELTKRICVLLFVWALIISLMWMMMFIMDQESMEFGYIIIWATESIFIITLLSIFINRLHKVLMQSTLRQGTNVTECNGKTLPFPSLSTRKSTDISVSMPTNEGDITTSNWKYICCMVRANLRSTKLSISSKRLSLIYMMTRCLVLSSISLITTAVFGIFLSIQRSIDIQSIYILYSMWSIDITINSCCLFLNFKFTDVFYKKCCVLCHKSCQNMLEYVSASKIVHNEAVKSMSDLQKVKSTSL